MRLLFFTLGQLEHQMTKASPKPPLRFALRDQFVEHNFGYELPGPKLWLVSIRQVVMRTSHTVFNAIGFTFAFLFAFSGCGQMMGGGRPIVLLWTMVITLLLGGGSLANFFERRLATWPTIAMIVGYFFSFYLFPLGIWGIVALVQPKRRKRR